MKFRSERSRKFLRNQSLLSAEEEFGEDPDVDFTVPEVFNTYAAQTDAASQVAQLLDQIREGRFVVLNFNATTEINEGVTYNTDGVGRQVAGRPEINITMTLIPGPTNDPSDDEYPDAGKPPVEPRRPAGADPVRLLILDDDD